MHGIDTNILIRYLTQDDAAQSPKATALIERRLSQANPGFISLVTIAEVVWVLGSIYRLPDTDIANTIERILQSDTLVVQNEQQVFTAMIALRNRTAQFPDALVATLGLWAGCKNTFTFDKKASRQAGFELV